MSLLLEYHLKELKFRIIYIILSIIISSLVAYENKEKLIYVIAKPLIERNIHFIYTGLGEAFLSYIKVSIITGILISIPTIIILNIYRYLKPGQYLYENQIVRNKIFIFIAVYVLGQIWYICYMSPILYEFFIGFGVEESIYYEIKLEAKINEFIHFTGGMLVVNTVCFLVPGWLSISDNFEKYGKYIIENRQYVIILIMLVSAIITPPDVISQIILGIPIIIMLELTWIINWLKKNYKEKITSKREE